MWRQALLSSGILFILLICLTLIIFISHYSNTCGNILIHIEDISKCTTLISNKYDDHTSLQLVYRGKSYGPVEMHISMHANNNQQNIRVVNKQWNNYFENGKLIMKNEYVTLTENLHLIIHFDTPFDINVNSVEIKVKKISNHQT